MFKNILCYYPKLLKYDNDLVRVCFKRCFRIRHRGSPPGIAKNLEQKLAEITYKDPTISFKVDIGLPPPARPRKSVVEERIKYSRAKRANTELERSARLLTLQVDLEDVKEEWKKTTAPKDIQKVANHYGVYDDLFGDAYFTPYVLLDIGFPQASGMEAPVHRGNVIKPEEAKCVPNVSFVSESSDLWTLVLTCPDGHLYEDKKEVLHWFVGNIPGGDVSKGQVICNYLPPFPPRGIGFQRHVFVLYKQDGHIDYSALCKSAPCVDINERTFESLEFYRQRQDLLTPGGLSFFQSDWDLSVRETFHKLLGLEEPVFEYDHLPRKLKEEQWFPKRRAFNLYLDNRRDPRDISLDFLREKLKETHPFQRPKKPALFPNLTKFDRNKMASWLITETRRKKLGVGRITQQQVDEYE